MRACMHVCIVYVATSGLLEVGPVAQDIHAMPGSGQSNDQTILDGTEAEDVLGVAWQAAKSLHCE